MTKALGLLAAALVCELLEAVSLQPSTCQYLMQHANWVHELHQESAGEGEREGGLAGDFLEGWLAIYCVHRL